MGGLRMARGNRKQPWAGRQDHKGLPLEWRSLRPAVLDGSRVLAFCQLCTGWWRGSVAHSL